MPDLTKDQCVAAISVAHRLLEDEDDFDVVDEIYNLPERSVQRVKTYLDNEGEPYSIEQLEPVRLFLDDDCDEGWSITDLTVMYLLNEGALQTSASHFHPGVWYSSGDSMTVNGITAQSRWHLKGFSPDEEASIFELFHRSL